jgi:hypothetical protein
MLFVIGAIAAIAIDVTTFYTARSEAQLAADSAALAAARVLANSGLTSTAAGPVSEEAVATLVAQQVATQNYVGGVLLTTGQVSVSYNGGASSFPTDPHVTVTITVQQPTFFARILGATQITVTASATAEAYNPSGAAVLSGGTAIPVAPLCVKPWLLPNIDPTRSAGGSQMFDTTGANLLPGLVGQGWPNGPIPQPLGNPNGLVSVCGPGSCTGTLPAPVGGEYYPGAMDNLSPAPAFATPLQALPAGSAGFNSYQLAIAGCVPQPISCGVNSATNPSAINIDTGGYVANNPGPHGRDADTVQAVGLLIHQNAQTGAVGDSDSIDGVYPFTPPFQFLGGNENPVASAVGKSILVSDSLVTVPVIDTTNLTNPVTVIGFLQLFLNPQPATLPISSPPAPTGSYQIPVTIINMAGCGTTATPQNATGTPIQGNGASPVAVRLITPP